MKERSGYVFQDKRGRWFARTTTTDDEGKRRHIVRRAKDKIEAKKVLKTILRQIEDEGEKSIDAARMTLTI